MPSTNDPGDKVGLQKTLDNLFIGTVLVPARQITLTTIGRAQRASGVRQLQDAIRENGFLASHAPLCCVLESLPLAELEEASSKGRLPPIKAIDGNHRIAAALANDQDALIPVRVHNPMTPMEEMMVAEGMNQVDANLVERCLVDEIIWMKNIIRFCQQEGGCNLGANALAARITAHYKKQNRKSPAKATLLRKIELITGLKPLALQAWKKVTIEAVGKNNKDFEHARVTMKMLTRKTFLEMEDEEQEIYILRLALAFNKNINCTEEQQTNLDDCARHVAAEVVRITTIVPRESWSDKFKDVVERIMHKENSCKYVLHQEYLHANVAEYKAGLPQKMKPCEPYVKALLGELQNISLRGFTSDTKMKPFYTIFVEKRAEAEIAAQSQKDAFESNQKKSTIDENADGRDIGSDDVGEVDDEGGAEGDGPASTVFPEATAKATRKTTEAASPIAKGKGEAGPGVEKGRGKRTSDDAGVTTGAEASRKKRTKEPAVPKILPEKIAVDKLASVSLYHEGFAEDILDPAWKPATTGLPMDGSTKLIFVNVAVHPEILTSEAKLKRVLLELASVLGPEGTLAMAMETSVSFNFAEIEGAMKGAGLILESCPPCSVYLSGQPGRVAASTRLHFASQLSTVLIAHKTASFTCNGGGVVRNSGGRAHTRPLTLEAPRQHALDNVGVILSDKHPGDGTYMAPAMAQFLLRRFTNMGDTVMSTAADKDDLSSLVLTSGRKYTALLSDPANEVALEAALNEAATDAVSRGFHAHHGADNISFKVGGTTLPTSVPVDKVAVAIREKMERGTEDDDDDVDG